VSESVSLAMIDCDLVADRAPRPQPLSLRLPAGSTVMDAVCAACEVWEEAVPEPRHLRVGVWGVEVRAAQPLRSGDRVELYRELPNDPRAARRARASGRRAGC
jgi:putative ubiquitin-RnfH superfamily antitoxin RatB of RatAB toxin-antitoxin module